MSFGKFQMKFHSDRKNVSSLLQQMSNLTGVLFKEDRSEGQVGTGLFFFFFKAWKTQICGSFPGNHGTIPAFPAAGGNYRKFIFTMYFRL